MAESERNAMFDACFEYDDHLRASGQLCRWRSAAGPAETALTLSWKNGKVATTDGPYAETKEQLGGILVLEARDMNHAVQLMAQHPSLNYGNILEIRPVGRHERNHQGKRAATETAHSTLKHLRNKSNTNPQRCGIINRTCRHRPPHLARVVDVSQRIGIEQQHIAALARLQRTRLLLHPKRARRVRSSPPAAPPAA